MPAQVYLHYDGMLLYELLGDGAESSFVRSWGVSYGLNAATEWKVRTAAGGCMHRARC
jgi:hypothetical protein